MNLDLQQPSYLQDTDATKEEKKDEVEEDDAEFERDEEENVDEVDKSDQTGLKVNINVTSISSRPAVEPKET